MLPDPPFRPLAPDEIVDPGALSTPTRSPAELTPDQRLLVLALAEHALVRTGSGPSALPTSADAARRIGWSERKFNKKLDQVCQKLAKAGVRGLHGGPGDIASNRRARLVEYCLASRVVTEDGPPRARPPAGGVRADLTAHRHLCQAATGSPSKSHPRGDAQAPAVADGWLSGVGPRRVRHADQGRHRMARALAPGVHDAHLPAPAPGHERRSRRSLRRTHRRRRPVDVYRLDIASPQVSESPVALPVDATVRTRKAQVADLGLHPWESVGVWRRDKCRDKIRRSMASRVHSFRHPARQWLVGLVAIRRGAAEVCRRPILAPAGLPRVSPARWSWQYRSCAFASLRRAGRARSR